MESPYSVLGVDYEVEPLLRRHHPHTEPGVTYRVTAIH